MNLPRFTVLVVHFLAGITLLALLTPSTFAQGANSLSVLGLPSSAFSRDQVFQLARLSGDETWPVGSSEKPEPVYLITAIKQFLANAACLAVIGLTLM